MVTDDGLTLWQTLKDRATQLLIKYKSGALITQFDEDEFNFYKQFLRKTLKFPILNKMWGSQQDSLVQKHLLSFFLCLPPTLLI